MKNPQPQSNKYKPSASLRSILVFSLALCPLLGLGTGCQKAPAPATPPIATPPLASPAELEASQAGPEVDFETDMANSITFMATIVEISPTSVTFESEGVRNTLPITPSTRLVAIGEIGDIKPNANIGIRTSADKKRLLILNGTWMD